MIKRNKWQIIFSMLLLLTPSVLGHLFWDQMRFPDGVKRMFVLWMPLTLIAGQIFCVWFTLKDPKNEKQSPKIVSMILWILPVISVFFSGVVYMMAVGTLSNMIGFSFLFLGAMFALMGNIMPKCKQNSTIGIKVKWALQDEENWNATHRFAGKVWVIGGFLFMGLVFLPAGLQIPGMLVGIFVLAFLPTIYSYKFYKKQIQEGTDNIKPIEVSATQKKAVKATMVFVPLILIGALILMVTGKVEVTCGEKEITLDATYWSDTTIAYEDIDKVEFRDHVPGNRVYGYGSAKLQLGSFENEEFGLYTRYTYGGERACIVLTVDDEIIVFSGDNDAATREIYKLLVQKGAGQ